MSNKNEKKTSQFSENDFHLKNLKSTFKKEWNDLNEFFMDKERKNKLQKMGTFRKLFFKTMWLGKSLWYELTPFRRILLIISIYLLFTTINYHCSGKVVDVRINFTWISVFILLFILLLELKDKLIATNELDAGWFIQKSLMPDKEPKVQNWDLFLYSQPAKEVGGDLLDFIICENGEIGLALGDIAGKGLRAALLMSRLQTILRAFVHEFPSISALVEKINEVYIKNSIKGIFASLIFLKFEPDSGKINYINAGHLPPVLIKKNKYYELKKGDPALGIINKVKYTEETIELEKDDIIFIYSDGLTEAQNNLGDFFGVDRMRSILLEYSDLKSSKIGEKILEKAKEYRGLEQQSDDISILVLKRKI